MRKRGAVGSGGFRGLSTSTSPKDDVRQENLPDSGSIDPAAIAAIALHAIVFPHTMAFNYCTLRKFVGVAGCREAEGARDPLPSLCDHGVGIAAHFALSLYSSMSDIVGGGLLLLMGARHPGSPPPPHSTSRLSKTLKYIGRTFFRGAWEYVVGGITGKFLLGRYDSWLKRKKAAAVPPTESETAALGMLSEAEDEPESRFSFSWFKRHLLGLSSSIAAAFVGDAAASGAMRGHMFVVRRMTGGVDEGRNRSLPGSILVEAAQIVASWPFRAFAIRQQFGRATGKGFGFGVESGFKTLGFEFGCQGLRLWQWMVWQWRAWVTLSVVFFAAFRKRTALGRYPQ